MAGPLQPIALNEDFDGEDVITHLIDTARSLQETDPVQSREFFEKALNLARNKQYYSGVAECLFDIAAFNKKEGNIKKSISFYQEAIQNFEKASNSEGACKSLFALSFIFQEINNYEEALDTLLKALQHCNKQDKPQLKGQILNRLGDVYKVLGDYHTAIENHKQALEIFESLGDKESILTTLYNIGNCYNWADELESAFTYLDKSLGIADELNDNLLRIKPTGSIAILFTKFKEYGKAKDYFFRAIDYVNLTNNLLLKADLLKSLGNLYIETGQYEDAIQILKESLAISEKLTNKFPKNLVHRFLAEAYERQGDFHNALLHHKSYTALSGELLNEEVAVKTKGLQLKFDLEEIKKEKELAEKTLQLKDQFIANISHEIRTPLNGVLGMANLLTDTNPSPEQLEYINTIRLSADNLIGIINDILDYSKISAGEIRFDSQEFRIRDLLTGILQVFKVKADEKKILLEGIYDDNIPETLIGDPLRLNQILFNLVNNAIKYTDKGKISVEMQMVSTIGLDMRILFKVTDTGIGIPEDKMSSIFESFTQFNPDKNRVYSGTGLGLAIVRQLLELQGGSISVNSKVGSGSIFKAEMPFRLVKKIEKKSRAGGGKQDVALKDLSRVKILLVEDNKVNQFLAQKLLSKMGFKVEIAGSGQEALECLKKSKYNVILMDVQMPGMNGYELTTHIREIMPPSVKKIPIIALTAYASNQEKEKALSVGMDDYITKPYSTNELLSVILRQVNKENPVAGISQSNETEISSPDIRHSAEKLLLLFSGNKEDVLSLLHMLVGQIPQLISEASKHISEENWPATFQSVHKLKSSVNLLKITTLRNLVAELEELSRDQLKTDRIPVVFNEFSKACELTVSLLKEEIIRLKKQ